MGEGDRCVKTLNTLLIRITVVTLLVLMDFTVPRPSRRTKKMPIVVKSISTTCKGCSPSAVISIRILPRRIPTPRPRPRIRARRRVVARARRRAIIMGPGTRPGGRGPGITGGPRGAPRRGTTRTGGLTRRGTRHRHGTTTRTTDGQITNTFNGNSRVKKDGNATASKRKIRKDGSNGSSAKTGSKIKKCKAFGLKKHSVKRNNLPHPMCGIRRRKHIIISVAMGPTNRIVTADVGQLAGAMGSALHGTTRSTTGGTHFGTISKMGGRAKAVACCFGLGWLVLEIPRPWGTKHFGFMASG